MKTNATQFEIMVNFMEQHGDIYQPTKHARGREQCIQDWERLTNLLNGDPTGEVKTAEKWKKVWSDLKYDTKKKATKINRAACGTGDGTAFHTKLTDLEQRVLNIIGPQAATGLLDVGEAGLPELQSDRDMNITLSPTTKGSSPATFTEDIILGRNSPVINIFTEDNVWAEPGPSHTTAPPATSAPTAPPEHQKPGPSLQQTPPHAVSKRASPSATTLHPASQGHTLRPHGRRSLRTKVRRFSRRRTVRQQSHRDETAQYFLHSEKEWRKYQQKKHEDSLQLEKERLRIRELEIQMQQNWQDITIKAIEAFDKIIESQFFKK